MVNKKIKTRSSSKVAKLKAENKALKETCEVLGNKEIMRDIKKSLKEISKEHLSDFLIYKNV